MNGINTLCPCIVCLLLPPHHKNVRFMHFWSTFYCTYLVAAAIYSVCVDSLQNILKVYNINRIALPCKIWCTRNVHTYPYKMLINTEVHGRCVCVVWDRVKGRARDKMYHHHEWHEIKLEWLRQRNILKYYVECDSWTRELNGVHIQCHLMVDFKWSLLYICQESLSSIAKASRNLIELDKVPEDFPRNVPVAKKKVKPKSGNQIKILFAIVLKW